MMKKVLMTVAMLSLFAAAPAFAGEWQSDAIGWYYVYDTGGYAKGGLVEINGTKYGFDQNGYMIVGWGWVDGNWHYFNSDGRMPSGWIQDGGRWYYLNEDGTPKVGWYNDGKNQYYFYSADDVGVINNAVEGAMATGTITVSGVTYYFDGEGQQKNVMESFERDGVWYRYRGGVLQWENINQKNDWIQFEDAKHLANDLQEMLVERYEGKRTYANSVQFEKDARQMLTERLMDPADLEVYIDDVLTEYWGRSSRRDTDDDDE